MMLGREFGHIKGTGMWGSCVKIIWQNLVEWQSFSENLVSGQEFILAHDIVLIFVRSGGLDNGYENSKWKTLEG